MFWDKQELILSTDKNKREKIIVSKCERQNKEYLDFRTHIYIDDKFVPSSKGFTLEFNKAKDFLSEIIEKI